MKSEGTRKWSDQQQAYFEWCKTGAGNLILDSLAGTGKTTTILEGSQYAPENRILLCAFNKKIAQELDERLEDMPKGYKCESKTLHALGLGFIKSAFRGVKVDDKRGWKLAEETAPTRLKRERDLVAMAARLASLAKETLPGMRGPTDLEPICFAFDLLDPRCPPESLSEWAFEAVDRAVNMADGCVDFSDMLYIPIKLKLARPSYQKVVVDEAQDMNASQLELALMAVNKGGRVCIVGDKHQAIYGFRGADSVALDRMAKRLNAKRLGLTVTYRCPKAVVNEAKLVVPEFTAHELAPEGQVKNWSDEALFGDAGPGDFVLGRTNASLMKACLKFIRLGKRARIEGKEIGKGLANMVKKLGGVTIEGFMANLHQWAGQQLGRAERDQDEKRKDQINDQVMTLEVLAAECDTLDELPRKLEHLFDDSHGPHEIITCSTVHKAKGLEADRVWILCDSFRVIPYKGQPELPTGEEANIWYVAVTRAKKQLIFVEEVRNGPEV